MAARPSTPPDTSQDNNDVLRERLDTITKAYSRFVPRQFLNLLGIEDIRKVDQERLLQSPFVTEDLTEDDLAMAKALLAQRSPEDIAAAVLYLAQAPSVTGVTIAVDGGQHLAWRTADSDVAE